MAEPSRLIGAVDLGGTKIYSAVVDDQGRVLGDDLRATDADQGQQVVIDRIAASLTAAAGADLDLLGGAGVAAPGPVDAGTGHLIDPPNLPGWGDVALGPLLSDRLGLRVVVENDAKAAAIGEYSAGNGRGAEALIYVTVSTGVGGGIVLGGKLYRGAGGSAGEIGHMVVQPNGPACGCGQLGCLEALASGTALSREGRLALEQGRAPLLRRLAAQAGGEVTAELVAQAALDGDADAAAIIHQAGAMLGIGLGNLVNVLNPDVIVVGGGTARIGTPLLGPAEASMRQTILARSAQRVQLRAAALEYAAIAGLAALVRAGQAPA